MEHVFLEVKNMSVSYGKKEVISNCDMTLREGRLTALLGLNGSGKTTMLKASCGLLKGSSKIWEICGEDAGQMNERRKAQLVSYVPQKNTIIYSISTTDVVTMGFNPYLKLFSTPSKEQKKTARNVIRELGLEEKVDVDFLSLSEGQKQLIILARAIVQNSPVMLFDEPDSALDFLNHHLILHKIRELIHSGGKSGLITLHDPNFALEYCDEILILKDGGVIDSFMPRLLAAEEIKQKMSQLYEDIEILEHNGKFVLIKATQEGERHGKDMESGFDY